MWALVLSALTIGYSLLVKNDETGGKSSSSSSKNDRITPTFDGFGLSEQDNRIFFAGAVFGLGCSLLYQSFVSYFRIHEHIRVYWNTWWRKSPISDIAWERAGPIRQARNFLTQTADGSIRCIVTPEIIATASLNVSLLTLHPGREIPTTRSAGVEFYYVLEGSGRFSQRGVRETATVQRGDCFVVYPGSSRWISNYNTGVNREDLVLLRATDGGTRYSRDQVLDVIRMDPEYKKKSTGAMERLRNGLHLSFLSAQDFLKRNATTTPTTTTTTTTSSSTNG